MAAAYLAHDHLDFAIAGNWRMEVLEIGNCRRFERNLVEAASMMMIDMACVDAKLADGMRHGWVSFAL